MYLYLCFRYTGDFCEILNNPCDPDPCYHGGTCTIEADGFKCVCTQHFLGNRCEAVRRYCLHDNPCDNNAVCEDKHDGIYRNLSIFFSVLHLNSFLFCSFLDCLFRRKCWVIHHCRHCCENFNVAHYSKSIKGI